MSETVKAFKKYLIGCGLADVTVDEDSLILSSDGFKKISTTEVGYYFNVEHSSEIYNKQDSHGLGLFANDSGVFIVDIETKCLLIYVPIYEGATPFINKNIASIVGHENAAIIVLNDLMNSFCYETR